jgi:hypothetical protein
VRNTPLLKHQLKPTFHETGSLQIATIDIKKVCQLVGDKVFQLVEFEKTSNNSGTRKIRPMFFGTLWVYATKNRQNAHCSVCRFHFMGVQSHIKPQSHF